MKVYGHSTEQEALDFADENSIDIGPDTYTGRRPRLTLLDSKGTTKQRITATGADYLFSRIDFFSGENLKVRASRMIAIIVDSRTELACWMPGAPTKHLTVHRGEGLLVVGNPENQTTTDFQLDHEITPSLTLPGGRFYTFEADPTADGLVVSGLYETTVSMYWDSMETPIEPGQEKIDTPSGVIYVPTNFRERYSTVPTNPQNK